MSYTKGSWIVKQSKFIDKLSIIEIDGDLIFAELTSGDSVPNEEHEANAHLIAAAPELLEACYRALLDYEKFGKLLDPAYGFIKQAIAKAEGKAI